MTRPDAPRDSRTPDPMHFERHAGTYGQARPPYPPQLWARLRDLGLLDPGLRAIDLGAGTGQATGPMLAAGLAVTAIDRLLEARTALDRVQATADEATAVLDRASQEVADLRAELRRAEQAEDKARQAATQAADDVHDARTAVQQTERALAEAARAVG